MFALSSLLVSISVSAVSAVSLSPSVLMLEMPGHERREERDYSCGSVECGGTGQS